MTKSFFVASDEYLGLFYFIGCFCVAEIALLRS